MTGAAARLDHDDQPRTFIAWESWGTPAVGVLCWSLVVDGLVGGW